MFTKIIIKKQFEKIKKKLNIAVKFLQKMIDEIHIPAKNDIPYVQTENRDGDLEIELFESKNKIFLIAPAAGIDEKNIEIFIKNDVLQISGNRPRPSFLPKPEKKFVEECFWGKFARKIILPKNVNYGEAIAKLERDIIIIEIPKIEKKDEKISDSEQK